jgi:putative SOS response-associated peptidase YedK
VRTLHPISAWPEIVRLYRLTLDYETSKNTAPAYNIAPTDEAPFVTAGDDGNHKLRKEPLGFDFHIRQSCAS